MPRVETIGKNDTLLEEETMTQEINLTEDQQNAISAFASFLYSDDPEMVISGPAGVGKTTVLRHLMDAEPHLKLAKVLGKELPERNWYLTATTNKAADVLGQSFDRAAETSTIHSLLGLRVENDYSSGKTRIRKRPDAPIISNGIVVIDEASMVDTSLRKYIREGTINSKIVYVGDHCQMAPVFEPLSPVFVDNERTEINQIVRSQHAPPITALANQLRQTVETGIFKPIYEVPGVIDFLSGSDAEQQIQGTFLDPYSDARILTYTNQNAINFNNYLRNFRQLPDHITAGEVLVSNSAVKNSVNRMVHVEQEITIYGVGSPYKWTPADGGPITVVDLDTSAGVLKAPWDPQEFQNHIKSYSRAKAWRPYFELKEQIADLRPRDACTVYKAQGSTYHTVFVNLTDIGKCTNPSQAARMLYVACSRPTHNIKFIGQLPARFRGEP